MYIYGIGPDAAFDLLRWRSQEGHVKLRALAEQVLADVLTLKHDKGAPLSRQTFDELFLTAHERVAAQKHLTRPGHRGRHTLNLCWASWCRRRPEVDHPPAQPMPPNGHTLGPNQVLVGHVACLGHGGGGHTSWHCRICDAVVYGPPLNIHCTALEGPATVRISTAR
jgi:hypothetical protein